MLAEPPNTPGSDPAPGSGAVAALDVAVDCSDLAGMRRGVREALTDLDDLFVQDVELICTELVANACDHAGGPRRLVLLRREFDGLPEVVVQSHDGSPEAAPRLGVSALGPHRGHGMKMVESLCRDWGVRVDGATKVVWAALRVP
ncbi:MULTISPECIES: ATP-binding protein [Actinosynnema]|uniref:ATP-binding protein n=1 Tax=Actinosynnema TaxID=40566 RepID=UPI0020A26847|nr:ATP-binding protein [Actinosynnema pretiosum]MCP2092766.1 hypothetical protein [Actinosynnema pretiosum]